MLEELQKYITGDLKNDCLTILEQYNKNITLVHTLAVVQKAREIGSQFNLDTDKLVIAAYLHDISVVIPRNEYANICNAYDVKVIELEEKLLILLHQKISKIIAHEIFNITDTEILSAVSCHTTLKANPSKCDMALFIADKLIWDQGGTPPYYNIVASALDKSLEMACLVYIDYAIDNGMVLVPHPDLLDARECLALR